MRVKFRYHVDRVGGRRPYRVSLRARPRRDAAWAPVGEARTWTRWGAHRWARRRMAAVSS